jgi:hypothetical protein
MIAPVMSFISLVEVAILALLMPYLGRLLVEHVINRNV